MVEYGGFKVAALRSPDLCGHHHWHCCGHFGGGGMVGLPAHAGNSVPAQTACNADSEQRRQPAHFCLTMGERYQFSQTIPWEPVICVTQGIGWPAGEVRREGVLSCAAPHRQQLSAKSRAALFPLNSALFGFRWPFGRHCRILVEGNRHEDVFIAMPAAVAAV
eukprot:1159104-Pelagomonas_calceolata.AAC.2